MKKHNPFRYFKTSPEVIRLAVMMYIRFPLSLRNIEDLLHERGIDICHESVRYWWNRLGPMFARKIMKRYGRPHVIVTDKLRSYRAAMDVIGSGHRQVTGRWKNNRAENSHLPFRRREQAMLKFRLRQTRQKFSSAHSSIHNHFNHERHLTSRTSFKDQRNAAIAEWRQLCAA